MAEALLRRKDPGDLSCIHPEERKPRGRLREDVLRAPAGDADRGLAVDGREALNNRSRLGIDHQEGRRPDAVPNHRPVRAHAGRVPNRTSGALGHADHSGRSVPKEKSLLVFGEHTLEVELRGREGRVDRRRQVDGAPGSAVGKRRRRRQIVDGKLLRASRSGRPRASPLFAPRTRRPCRLAPSPGGAGRPAVGALPPLRHRTRAKDGSPPRRRRRWRRARRSPGATLGRGTPTGPGAYQTG